jgi:hypothetical protein
MIGSACAQRSRLEGVEGVEARNDETGQPARGRFRIA